MTSSSKRVMREFSLIRFYFVLTISIIFFAAQLVISHLTHCLILQIDSYHMLYNILSLITSIVTVRMSRSPASNKFRFQIDQAKLTITGDDDVVKEEERSTKEGSVLKNTFGWTRIDVCGAVANLCFLSALAFSVVAESLQTMVHASHHFSLTQTMLCWSRLVQAVPIVGAIGLVVNGICVLTIGGYTFHQSTLLSSDQELVDDNVIISSSVQQYVQQGIKSRRRQSLLATFRDIFGTILVIIVGLVVYTVMPTAEDLEGHEVMCNSSQTGQMGHGYEDLHAARADADGSITIYDAIYYLDPGLCIVAVIVLALLSISYAKEAGHILLLTIPDHINVQSLSEDMRQQFPEICDIHELHVWQLTPGRIIASAHIVLQHAQGYLAIQNNVVDFLKGRGISHVTLQPEFVEFEGMKESPATTRHRKCFLPCDKENCREKQCCETTHLSPCNSHQPLNQMDSHSHSHSHGHSHLHDDEEDTKPRSSTSVKVRLNNEDATVAEPAELEPMI